MYLFPERIQQKSQQFDNAENKQQEGTEATTSSRQNVHKQQVSTKVTKNNRNNVLPEPALFSRSTASFGEEADFAFHGRSTSEEGPGLNNAITMANQNWRLPQP